MSQVCYLDPGHDLQALSPIPAQLILFVLKLQLSLLLATEASRVIHSVYKYTNILSPQLVSRAGTKSFIQQTLRTRSVMGVGGSKMKTVPASK